MARTPNLEDDLDSLLDRALRGDGDVTDEKLRARLSQAFPALKPPVQAPAVRPPAPAAPAAAATARPVPTPSPMTAESTGPVEGPASGGPGGSGPSLAEA